MTITLPQRKDFPTVVDTDVEPWSIEEIEVRTRSISRRLMEINKQQIHNNDEWIKAVAAYKKPRETRVVELYAADQGLPKWACEAKADAELSDEAAVAFAWERIVRSHNDEAHSLRQVQSSLQSLYRQTGDEVGTSYRRRA